MNKRRIQVYSDPETKRRIELAAAKKQTSVTEYCLAAIEQQLADDDMLEREQINIPVTQLEAALIADLRQLLQRRRVFDLDAVEGEARRVR